MGAREGGTGEKETVSGLLLPTHTPWQRWGIEKSNTLENRSAQAACTVPQPRVLSSAVVTAENQRNGTVE